MLTVLSVGEPWHKSHFFHIIQKPHSVRSPGWQNVSCTSKTGWGIKSCAWNMTKRPNNPAAPSKKRRKETKNEGGGRGGVFKTSPCEKLKLKKTLSQKVRIHWSRRGNGHSSLVWWAGYCTCLLVYELKDNLMCWLIDELLLVLIEGTNATTTNWLLLVRW